MALPHHAHREGRRFASEQVHILRFLDGKAVEHWAVRDDLGMVRDLGVIGGPSRWAPVADPEKG